MNGARSRNNASAHWPRVNKGRSITLPPIPYRTSKRRGRNKGKEKRKRKKKKRSTAINNTCLGCTNTLERVRISEATTQETPARKSTTPPLSAASPTRVFPHLASVPYFRHRISLSRRRYSPPSCPNFRSFNKRLSMHWRHRSSTPFARFSVRTTDTPPAPQEAPGAWTTQSLMLTAASLFLLPRRSPTYHAALAISP
ncbi:hypothetical protein VTK56DRAFT_5997 [Thermocarpiscus australiensis]